MKRLWPVASPEFVDRFGVGAERKSETLVNRATPGDEREGSGLGDME